jgi:HSP20 family protein
MFQPLAVFSRARRDPALTESQSRDPFYRLQHEMNRLFDEAFTRFPSFGSSFAADVSPRIDICETDRALEVEAELPGVSENDVDIELADNVLTIRGEKRSEKQDKGKNGYQYMERSYGSFSRSIPLPFEVDSNKVDASFKDGVLKLTLPKPPEAQRRTKKIEIKRP